MSADLLLAPGAARLDELAEVYWHGLGVRLVPEARAAVDASAERVAAAARGRDPVYGINTGFGKLAQKRIAPADRLRLQRNLVLSHCCGVGAALPARIVRLVMALKLLSLGRGASGVRWVVIERLQEMLAHGITPVIPAQGSVGASGDLAPLAHLAAVLIGEGEAFFGGRRVGGAEALAAAGLEPLELAPKEGLGLINGTQVSTALALAALFEAWRCCNGSLVAGALSSDAIKASTAPFDEALLRLRGHRGPLEVGRSLTTLLAGSAIRESHLRDDERVQDPYSVRCQPQVLGACLDVLRHAAHTLTVEANAVTDNPLVLEGDAGIVSGGNFHAEPVALAADQMALAIAEAGTIAQRRVALLVDPAMNSGLPPFLTPDPGLNSGLMMAEVTSAALMAENKQRATPCAVDSTPTSANQEDHVSMATHGARRLLEMVDNLGRIVGIELIAAAAGVECRAPVATSPPLARVIARLREEVKPMGEDRYLAPDIEAASALIRSGAIVDVAGAAVLPDLFAGSDADDAAPAR